eukprot:5338874-Pleurochrysis_carterae.AAC.1
MPPLRKGDSSTSSKNECGHPPPVASANAWAGLRGVHEVRQIDHSACCGPARGARSGRPPP